MNFDRSSLVDDFWTPRLGAPRGFINLIRSIVHRPNLVVILPVNWIEIEVVADGCSRLCYEFESLRYLPSSSIFVNLNISKISQTSATYRVNISWQLGREGTMSISSRPCIWRNCVQSGNLLASQRFVPPRMPQTPGVEWSPRMGAIESRLCFPMV